MDIAETVVTVVVALVGVLGFVAVLACALVGPLVRLQDADPDARPLLARRHPARVPHSAAGVQATAAPTVPVVPADAPSRRDERIAA